MSSPKISVFASSIRPWNWEPFFKSIESTTEDYEVVFAGPIDLGLIGKHLLAYDRLRFIKTENIKPAQGYEVARRACIGEVISWSADDCEYSPDCLGMAYRYWKSLGHEKVALSIQTIEDGHRFNMNHHSFVGFDPSTPLMAPVNLMSRKVLDDLGGLDRRFCAGQYENSIIMELYEVGGSVVIFDKGEVTIDHMKKHKNQHKFRAGYTLDRQVLESIWGKRGELLRTGKAKKHEPYSDKDILLRSQSNNMPSIWC